MRVTRPTMNRSSMASTRTTMGAPLKPEVIRAARSGASGGSSIIGANGSERQRDEHEEHHQELRVAEVVLDHAGAEHRGDYRQPAGGKRRIGLLAELPE